MKMLFLMKAQWLLSFSLVLIWVLLNWATGFTLGLKNIDLLLIFILLMRLLLCTQNE
ncbi:hypothetical protein Patl1_35432 [Pistacia atlantica]|nr:hypothetical protein Patl1_35432 [Pistacia atlantica]